MKTHNMIIGGKSVGTTVQLPVINPATAEPFAQVAAGDISHLDAAVAAARAAFPAWSQLPERERQRSLQEIAVLIAAHQEELMELVLLETGKPLAGLNGVGAGMEVGGTLAWIHATAALSLPPEVIQDDVAARIELHRKPLGVVGSITPWNWPLMIATWHIMPALLAGNTVVVKPSELSPVSTLRMVELANVVLPPGVLNAVTGDGSVGAAMARHPGIDKIVFTGSTPTGRKIMAAGADNLKRLTLELGGNDAGIVLPDASPEAVAPAIFAAAFHNNGQTCACLKRLYVHESLHDALCAELVKHAASVVVGDGARPETQLGPVQNSRQLAIILELVKDAEAHGGRILCGGRAISGPGYFFQPTLIADVSNGVRLVDEEQFGPVLPIIKYREVDEAVRLANDNPNGLGGSIWSADTAKASELASRLECGTVWINEHGAVQPNMPFGGVKQSGLGVEFGRYGLEEYTNIQAVKVMKS